VCVCVCVCLCCCADLSLAVYVHLRRDVVRHVRYPSSPAHTHRHTSPHGTLHGRGYSNEFALYFNYVRSLRFDDKPDYSYLRKLFRDLFVAQGFLYDYMFDWSLMKQQSENKAAAAAAAGAAAAEDGPGPGKTNDDNDDNNDAGPHKYIPAALRMMSGSRPNTGDSKG
jgi:hypothetical protein